MEITWQIRVTGKDGVAKTTITPDDGVAEIEAVGLDGMGSCQEATIVALPQAVDLVPRDTIEIDYSLDGGDTWVSNLYKGVIVSAPNERSARLGEFRAVGLKARLYEILVNTPYLAGGDVATQAALIAQSGINTAGVQDGIIGYSTPFSPAITALGFTVGARATGLQTAGEALDDLAALVGSFTVPIGDTYTYGGKTWTAGEVVPAARWGVDGAGIFFFGRPTGDRRTFGETDEDVSIDWNPVEAEEVVDRVTLVYAAELTAGGVLRIDGIFVGEEEPTQAVVPLTVSAGDGEWHAARVVPLEAPLDLMEDDPDATSTTGTTNGSNAFDGDSATYATMTDTTGTLKVEAGAEGCIVRLDVQQNTTRMTIGGDEGANLEVNINFYRNDGAVLLAQLRYRIPPTTTDERRLYTFPVLVPVSIADDVTDCEFALRAATGVRVYALETFRPIAASAEQLGRVLARTPKETVAAVRYRGLVEHPRWTDAATRRPTARIAARQPDGSSINVDADIERLEYSFTTEQGAKTEVLLGQGYPSDDEIMAVVLERLARRATRTSIPPRRSP